MKVSFTVAGTPIPQGSIRAFMPKGWTRPILTSDNPKLKLWRATVNIHAQSAMRCQCQDLAEKDVPVKIRVMFWFRRPKSVKASMSKTSKPDVDKLVRSVLDSLTGVVYTDDSQVVHVEAFKGYDGKERVEISAETLENRGDLLWQHQAS